MSKQRTPRVVAELGRPETPQETAARKAENSRNYRMRKTVNNLVFSLLVTVGLVLVIVLAVPRDDTPHHVDHDFVSIAAEAQPAYSQQLAAPALPDGWTSNYAELRTGGASGVVSWNIGLNTPADPTPQFIAIAQGLDANPTWVATTLNNTLASDTTVIDGITWTVYDNRESSADVGNVSYGLTTEAGGSTFVVFGTADDDEFDIVARALTPAITANKNGTE